MSFVKTSEELERYYQLGIREFPQVSMMGLMFKADADLTRRLLPQPLEQSPMPGGLIFIAEYGDTNLGPGYREAAMFLRCSYEGTPGNYCLSMPIDSDANRLHNGRDIYGFPKKAAKVHFERKGNTAHGWVERRGVRFFELKVELTGSLPELPASGPTYLFKGMPKADLTPGFDGPVLLVAQHTEVKPKSVEIGPCEMAFEASDSDPWSELQGLEPMMAFHIESSNRMLPGKVIAEVDADSYLPHYFRMTDFYCG